VEQRATEKAVDALALSKERGNRGKFRGEKEALMRT